MKEVDDVTEQLLLSRGLPKISFNFKLCPRLKKFERD